VGEELLHTGFFFGQGEQRCGLAVSRICRDRSRAKGHGLGAGGVASSDSVQEYLGVGGPVMHFVANHQTGLPFHIPYPVVQQPLITVSAPIHTHVACCLGAFPLITGFLKVVDPPFDDVEF